MNPDFWRNRRVFLTGHTGFKGAWLALWLKLLAARVTGFALAPTDPPNLYTAALVGEDVESLTGDVRDVAALTDALARSKAEIVFHCAAQSLVRESYRSPVDTYATNVMGTVHLLEAIRSTGGISAVIVVTSDKCYDLTDAEHPRLERDRLGGADPYSSSKACAELVTSAYRTSYFSATSAVSIATARAGNVIGGGDWSADRLIPDVMRAWADSRVALIRNPDAIRPWQHVLEPLHGYLLLAEAMQSPNRVHGSWNFGPSEEDMRPVSDVVDSLVRRWGNDARWRVDGGSHPREAEVLRLDSSLARTRLNWRPRLTLEAALDWTVEWYKAYVDAPDSARRTTIEQIRRYQTSLS